MANSYLFHGGLWIFIGDLFLWILFIGGSWFLLARNPSIWEQEEDEE